MEHPMDNEESTGWNDPSMLHNLQEADEIERWISQSSELVAMDDADFNRITEEELLRMIDSSGTNLPTDPNYFTNFLQQQGHLVQQDHKLFLEQQLALVKEEAAFQQQHFFSQPFPSIPNTPQQGPFKTPTQPSTPASNFGTPGTPANTASYPASPYHNSFQSVPSTPYSTPGVQTHLPSADSTVTLPSSAQVSASEKQATQKIIHDINELSKQISGTQFVAIARQQKTLSPGADPSVVTALHQEQARLKEALEWSGQQLITLVNSTYLDPQEMYHALRLQQEVFILLRHLGLYASELSSIQSGNPLPSFALVVLVDPFPDSVKQHKTIDEPLQVKLLSSSKFDNTMMNLNCIVKAEVVTSSSKKTKKAVIGLENAEKPLENATSIAKFHDLKFPSGTRVKAIRLKFTTKFAISDHAGRLHQITLESNPTGSVVVKTNENQWCEAEGILLKKTAFGDQTEIPYARFANYLQQHYLRTTKQDMLYPVRALALHDVTYIHRTKFGGKPSINNKDFQLFWEWFGPLSHKFRHQKHLGALWTKGMICGFMTREEAELVLSREAVGTFLLRVSERQDQMVISYQANTAHGVQVKHYLIKSDDIHGTKKTLADFLRNYAELLCILQIHVEKDSGRRILRKLEKNVALKEFYAKKTEGSNNGYDDAVMVNEQR
eukprot:TRINITY_DN5444_c0_g1_i1.p1 TRINITY_DN5444_c0_g1~~TRINITY_DN5444_c0_g1_i1.p1  ORF type:complete len:666 (+),score=179.00 TRINITY_DN5444_c0_g1_i1:88-2085(+)